MMDLVDGSLDIGVMYTPQSRPGLRVEHLLDEELILVTSDTTKTAGPHVEKYVHVDWGPEFLVELTGSLPELSSPQVIVGVGWLGLQRILMAGGSGYFPQRLVRAFIHEGQLSAVRTAPSFQLPAWVVYPSTPRNSLISHMVRTLHGIAGSSN